MFTIALGLIAALAWGIHDIVVRYVSQKTNIFTALFTVLVLGAVFQFIAVLLRGDLAPIPSAAFGSIGVSGLFFTIAGIALYKAFEIGPVRLVSPLIATFSVLAVLWGVAQGQPFTALQWGAVLAVLAGITIVATLSDPDTEIQSTQARNHAITWSLLASISFTITFETGQSSMHMAPELMVVVTTRLVAIITMIPIMIYIGAKFIPARSQLPILSMMAMMDAIAITCVLSAGNLPNSNYATVASSAFGLITIVLAYLFLKERMTRVQWGGVILAFLGIAYLAL
jgi:drug/metabolite transporter (DMT)-like permease